MKRPKRKKCPIQHKDMLPSQGAAIRAAISYSKKRGVALRPYFHHACGSWHLTHTARLDNNTERRSA